MVVFQNSSKNKLAIQQETRWSDTSTNSRARVYQYNSACHTELTLTYTSIYTVRKVVQTQRTPFFRSKQREMLENVIKECRLTAIEVVECCGAKSVEAATVLTYWSSSGGERTARRLPGGRVDTTTDTRTHTHR